MTRDEEIELADLNLEESYRDFARRTGGAALDEDGLLLWAGGHWLPALQNGAMRLEPGLAGEEVLARADAFFGARGRGYTVVTRPHEPDEDVVAAAGVAGMEPFGNPPAMILREPLPDQPVPAGVSVEQVVDASSTAAFGEVMDLAYGDLGMPSGVAPQILPKAVLTAPHVAAFVMRDRDGTPVAGALSFLSHGVGGVYWVGTTPAARGQGLAEYCTRLAGNAAFEAGARRVVLQASEMGEPVYRRMGYEEIARYRSFMRVTPPKS